MKFFVDLHIHSNLSPCADDDMTPNDIIAMARLKGLDIIAITDHNSCGNLKAVEKIIKDKKDIVVIPGIEVTTSEEIHVLCYFYDFKSAIDFSDYLYDHIPNFKNKNNIFGKQIIMDENDNQIRIEEKLLVTAIDLDLIETINLCKKYKGVCVPAHVNKASNSILMTLGMIPKECEFSTVEVHKNSPCSMKDIEGYKVIYSSDAHSLENIFEKTFCLDLEEKSIKAVLNYLKKGE